MRTFLAVVGTITLVCVFAVFGSGLFLLSQLGPLMDEAKAYADKSIVAIATEWRVEELTSRGSPEFLDATTPERLDEIITQSAELFGGLINYHNGAICEIAQQYYSTSRPHYASSVCYALVEFEKAEGKFKLSLIKRQNTWKIRGFVLNEIRYKDAPELLAETGSHRLAENHDNDAGAWWLPMLQLSLHLSLRDGSLGIEDPTVTPPERGAHILSHVAP